MTPYCRGVELNHDTHIFQLVNFSSSSSHHCQESTFSTLSNSANVDHVLFAFIYLYDLDMKKALPWPTHELAWFFLSWHLSLFASRHHEPSFLISLLISPFDLLHSFHSFHRWTFVRFDVVAYSRTWFLRGIFFVAVNIYARVNFIFSSSFFCLIFYSVDFLFWSNAQHHSSFLLYLLHFISCFFASSTSFFSLSL